MSEFEKIQKLVRDMQSSETPVLPVYEPNLFSIAKEAYRLARAEVIEEVKELFTDMWDSTFFNKNSNITKTNQTKRGGEMSEETKAPEIPGFRETERNIWIKLKSENRAVAIVQGTQFYYKRSKPKEKSIREIIQEELKLWSHSNRDLFANAFERILENYVKKEGGDD